MTDERQCQMEELVDEVHIILSIKDIVSEEEVENLVNKFDLLSEYDIRNQISEITGDKAYIDELTNRSEGIIAEKEDKAIVQHTNAKEIDEIVQKQQDSFQISNDDFIENNTNSEKNEFKNIEIHNFDENNMPEVPFIKAECKYGQISLEWEWTENINKILLCYRMDKFPASPKDSCASKVNIERKRGDNIGSFIINKVVEGNYYFCIYVVIDLNDKVLFSNGQRRLVVNKKPSEVYYEIKTKRNILGKLRAAEVVLFTNEDEINLPQFVLVGKIGNMPLQKSDGKNLLNIDYQTLTKGNSLIINLPIEGIDKNMYVKLFFLDDSNSKLYRIVSPSKDKLYFK